MTIYDEVAAERARAHALHGPASMEAMSVRAWVRATILAEEAGEVAKEFNEASIRAIRAGGSEADGPDYLDMARVRKELIQTAAMAVAWADSIVLCEYVGQAHHHHPPDHPDEPAYGYLNAETRGVCPVTVPCPAERQP